MALVRARRRPPNRSVGLRDFAVLAALLTPGLAAAQPVADQDTLLLAQFDQSCDADFSLGDPIARSSAAPTAGRFGGGLDLRPGRDAVFVGDDGNFNPAEGTLEFWIRPHWPGADSEKHSLFSCRFGEKGYININTLGNGRLGIAVSAGEGKDWLWRRADADISAWPADQWRHAAFAWGRGQLHVYVDGREGVRAVTDARMPAQAPATLNLLGGDAAIDAFRISKRMSTEEEVQRSIQSALGPPPYLFLGDAGDRALLRARVLLGLRRIPLILGSSRYQKGFALRPGQEATTTLDGAYETFRAIAGVDALSPARAACSLEVWGDGKKLFASDPRLARQKPSPITIPISGVRKLKLLARDVGRSRSGTLCVWANATAARADARVFAPPARPLKPEELEMYRRQFTADAYSFQPPVPGPFFVAGKFWEDELDPAQPPDRAKIGTALRAFGAPGEYEPLNFVVYAVEDLEKTAVDVSDLRCGDAVLPASRIDVRLVLRGLMRDVYTLPRERSTVVSRFLIVNRRADLPGGDMREYHMTVHVPEDAAPGRYAGRVRIAPANAPALELPVEFEVLPLRYRPLQRKTYGVYYRLPVEDDGGRRADMELADIRAHGGSFVKWPLGVQYDADDGRVRVSLSSLDRGLALLRKHGFRGPLPVSTGCEQAARLLHYDPVFDHDNEAARQRFFAVVKTAMTQLKELAADKYPEFELLPTHMDEVFGRDRLDRYIRLTEAVRQVPSLRVYITLHNSPRRGAAEIMRQCDPYVDVRCYNGHVMDEWIRAGHSFAELKQELDRAGDEAWTYYNIRGSFFRPEWTRLVNGFYLWISPLRAHVPWMYHSYSGNPLDELDGPRERGHDFVYAAPDPEDPSRLVSTRHWEAYREGIDDMRYLCTLEDLIAEHPAAPAARSAKDWLARLRESITPTQADLAPIERESPILIWLSERFDGADYRRVRREAAEHIERLLRLP